VVRGFRFVNFFDLKLFHLLEVQFKLHWDAIVQAIPKITSDRLSDEYKSYVRCFEADKTRAILEEKQIWDVISKKVFDRPVKINAKVFDKPQSVSGSIQPVVDTEAKLH
jgi:hypothetical protein